MQSGGVNLYVKLVLMTIKIKFYFWKKTGFVTLCIKKKKRCENCLFLRNIYSTLVSAMYVCREMSLTSFTVCFYS